MKANRIENLGDLFLEELGDLYNAENQLIKALPDMAKAAESSELKSAIEEHLQQTKNQANRLEQIFKDLGQKPKSVTCKAMQGLIEEGKELIHKSDKNSARDAAIIGAAQRVEHYEIAGYGTAKSHASLLGHTHIEGLLAETLKEEKNANSTLNELAEGNINSQAKGCGCSHDPDESEVSNK